MISLISKQKLEYGIKNLVFELDSLDGEQKRNAEERLQRLKNKYFDEEKKYNKIKSEKKIPDLIIKKLYSWIIDNHGDVTLENFMNDTITSPEQREQIIDFLKNNSYIALPIKVKEQNYLLVHAMPPKNFESIKKLRNGQGLKLKDVDKNEFRFMTCRRKEDGESTYSDFKQYGFLTICGHEPEYKEIIKDKKEGFIRIDTGCGHKIEGDSKLALYCINDESVKYFDEQEEYSSFDKTDSDSR